MSINNAELYPTSIRSSVMGLHGQVARAGSIAAPFILLLGQQMGSATFLPFILYGATSLLAGMMLMAMPETLGPPMPETMEVGDLVHFRQYSRYTHLVTSLMVAGIFCTVAEQKGVAAFTCNAGCWINAARGPEKVAAAFTNVDCLISPHKGKSR